MQIFHFIHWQQQENPCFYFLFPFLSFFLRYFLFVAVVEGFRKYFSIFCVLNGACYPQFVLSGSAAKQQCNPIFPPANDGKHSVCCTNTLVPTQQSERKTPKSMQSILHLTSGKGNNNSNNTKQKDNSQSYPNTHTLAHMNCMKNISYNSKKEGLRCVQQQPMTVRVILIGNCCYCVQSSQKK